MATVAVRGQVGDDILHSGTTEAAASDVLLKINLIKFSSFAFPSRRFRRGVEAF